jgi:cell division septal protein FtsQ
MKPKRAVFFRKFGKIAGYGLLVCLFSGMVYWLCSWLFTVKNIVVVGTNIQVAVDEARLPKSLLLFPTAKFRAELLADNPILADIQFQKKYPHTLVIVPTLRTAVVRLSLTAREVLLDGAGVVLSDVDASSPVLPHLVVPLPTARIGEMIRDSRVLAGISFITGIQNILPIQTIIVEDELSLRAKSDTLDIVFPQDAPMSVTLATLQTLLSGFRIKGILPTFIDLRFNKPIIKF